MPVPDFSPGEVLTAAAMDSIGMWLIKTQTIGTAVSSVTVTGAFSADYDNYKIVVSGGVSTGGQAVAFQFGPSSVAGYNSGYSSNIIIYNFATPPVLTSLASLAATNWPYVGESNANNIAIDIDVIAPNLAKFSTYHGGYIGSDVAGTAGGVHKEAQRYTDFTLSGANPFTGGTIRVYGYRN
jgi:hypothetical protein